MTSRYLSICLIHFHNISAWKTKRPDSIYASLRFEAASAACGDCDWLGCKQICNSSTHPVHMLSRHLLRRDKGNRFSRVGTRYPRARTRNRRPMLSPIGDDLHRNRPALSGGRGQIRREGEGHFGFDEIAILTCQDWLTDGLLKSAMTTLASANATAIRRPRRRWRSRRCAYRAS